MGDKNKKDPGEKKNEGKTAPRLQLAKLQKGETGQGAIHTQRQQGRKGESIKTLSSGKVLQKVQSEKEKGNKVDKGTNEAHEGRGNRKEVKAKIFTRERLVDMIRQSETKTGREKQSVMSYTQREKLESLRVKIKEYPQNRLMNVQRTSEGGKGEASLKTCADTNTSNAGGNEPRGSATFYVGSWGGEGRRGKAANQVEVFKHIDSTVGCVTK